MSTAAISRTRSAAVHIEDRGLQFADAIYEVCSVNDGLLLDEEGHLDRLERSLRELAIPMPMGRGGADGGDARSDAPQPAEGRAHLFAGHARRLSPRPCDPAFRQARALSSRRAASIPRATTSAVPKAFRVVTLKDIRWGRCDIKTTGLLPNVLAKTQARKGGAYEAWLVDDEGLRHRRRLDQCLDRDQERRAGHARSEGQHPCRRHPQGRARRLVASRHQCDRRTRVHGEGSRTTRAKHSSRRRAAG